MLFSKSVYGLPLSSSWSKPSSSHSLTSLLASLPTILQFILHKAVKAIPLKHTPGHVTSSSKLSKDSFFKQNEIQDSYNESCGIAGFLTHTDRDTDIDTYKHTHTHTHTHLPLCLISSLTNLLTYSAPGAMASVLFLENSGSLLKFEGGWIQKTLALS